MHRVAHLHCAVYNMFNINHDGVVALEEFRTVMKIAYGCDAKETAVTFYLLSRHQ